MTKQYFNAIEGSALYSMASALLYKETKTVVPIIQYSLLHFGRNVHVYEYENVHDE